MQTSDNAVPLVEAPAAVVPRCHMPWQQMVIDSSGYVAPCCYWGAVDNPDGASLGNFNTQTIEEIWNGPGYRKLRAGMAKGDLAAAGCEGCQAIRQGMALGFEYDPASGNEPGEPSAYAQNVAVLKREIAAGATVLDAKPTIVSYTPSHKCNIRCTHCYQDSTRTAAISRTKADADVEALAPFLVRLVAGGGEPFLLPIWRRFVTDFDLSTNPYLAFSASTNATILTPEIESGLKRFKKLVINISIDGTGETYERVRVGANWASVRENVRRLRSIAASAEDTASAVGVSMCVMKSSILDLPNFVRYATDDRLSFGIWPVTQLPPAESLRHFDNAALEVDGWADAIDEAERLTHTLYLPEAAKWRNAPAADASEHTFWKTNFQLLRDAIPFDLPRVPATRREVRLPEPLVAQFPDLASKAGARVYIFQLGRTAMPFAHGHAAGGTLEVALPPGAYCLNVPRGEGEIPNYWDGVRFRVAAGENQITATYHALTRRRIDERIQRLGVPAHTSRWIAETIPWVTR